MDKRGLPRPYTDEERPEMKIICESCGAKYSIADEKVAGKVFKIRCKKCSEVIVVRGDQPEDPEEETRVFDYGTDASWHVVVDGDQQGPMTPAQIGDLLAEGRIDWEAYVWKEGFDNWQPAKDVEPLVAAIMSESDGGAAPQAAAASQEEINTQVGAAPQAADQFSGSGDMGADPFAGDDGGLSGLVDQPVASASAAGGAADLFAGADAGEDFSGGPPEEEEPADVATSARVSQAEAMTGQRNENSVLFSLSNLQALATSSGSSPPPSADRPGMAQGEGSGLIDIRALASANQAMKDNDPGTSQSADNVEDLLAVGGGGSTFSAAAIAAPVAAEKPESSNKLVLGLVAALGVLVLALGGVVVAVLLKDDPGPVAAAGDDPATPAAAAAAAAVPTAAGAAEAAKPAAEAEPTAAADDEAEESDEDGRRVAEEEDDSDDEGRSRSRSSKRRRRAKRSSDSSSSSAKSDDSASKPEPKPEAKPQRKGGGDIDSLLSAALGGGGSKSKRRSRRSSSSSADLPQTPGRSDVKRALQSVAGAVKSCGQGKSGVAMTKVTVAGKTGRVTNAVVSGSFAGTPVGSCVAGKVRRARFPKFKQSTFSVSYPYRL